MIAGPNEVAAQQLVEATAEDAVAGIETSRRMPEQPPNEIERWTPDGLYVEEVLARTSVMTAGRAALGAHRGKRPHRARLAGLSARLSAATPPRPGIRPLTAQGWTEPHPEANITYYYVDEHDV